jgi:hypothetical protein
LRTKSVKIVLNFTGAIMFTGIIQTVGQIERVTPMGEDVKLNIFCNGLDMQDVKRGDSIAVNGVCLTAIGLNESHFEAHVSRETLSVTIGLDKPNAANLEKALRLNDRLGGHLVSMLTALAKWYFLRNWVIAGNWTFVPRMPSQNIFQ